MARTWTTDYKKIEEITKTKFYNNNWFVGICFYLLGLLSSYIVDILKHFFK